MFGGGVVLGTGLGLLRENKNLGSSGGFSRREGFLINLSSLYFLFFQGSKPEKDITLCLPACFTLWPCWSLRV